VTAIVLQGDARHLPLPDGCADLVVTSPPYFGLRSYTDGGEHYAGQIGSEATPAEYIAALVECTREWVRVLKPSGSMFINLGDKYSSPQGPRTGRKSDGLLSTRNGHGGGPKWPTSERTDAIAGFREKSLLGLPWRYALACMDQLGLILRAEVIWAKPNGLPESVTDRVRRAHEQVFHFTRQPRYYAAVDEIREPHEARPQRRFTAMKPTSLNNHDRVGGWQGMARDEPANDGHPLGKLPGSVWSIPSAPLVVPPEVGVDHFAAFPPALVRPIILGWSPPGICTACGEGRRPVVVAEFDTQGRTTNGPKNDARGTVGALHMAASIRSVRSTTITGYACMCSERACRRCVETDAGLVCQADLGGVCAKNALPPTRPAVVLDPFGGTGTTALVATTHGRIGIGVDLSADYCRLARWRVRDPGERARARDMPKPPPIPPGMEPLFEMEA